MFMDRDARRPNYVRNGIATTHVDYREVSSSRSMRHYRFARSLACAHGGRRPGSSKDVYLKSQSPTPLRKAPPSAVRSAPASKSCSAACSSAAGATFAMPSISFREEAWARTPGQNLWVQNYHVFMAQTGRYPGP